MRIAYFDCSTGISGDMVLGALVDAGLSEKHLINELKKLKLDGYKLTASKVRTGPNIATKVDVHTKPLDEKRTLGDILGIINSSKLSSGVKALAKRIFTRLAEAESMVHRKPIGKLHFHELGSTDAIIDIVGCAIGIDKLGIKKVYSSALNIGHGKVTAKHGVFSVPAPATAKLEGPALPRAESAFPARIDYPQPCARAGCFRHGTDAQVDITSF